MLLTCISVVFLTNLIVVFSQHSCSTNGCVLVQNKCPFTLYMQRTIIDGVDNRPSKVTSISSNGEKVLDISGWPENIGQRLYAWWKDPIISDLHPLEWRDKVEINNRCFHETKMCYNPSAVDYFGLPVTIGPYNPSDCPNVEYTGQNTLDLNDIKSNCPTKYIETSPAGVCIAPFRLCELEPSHSLCNHLASSIQQCKNDGVCPNGITSSQVYACGPPWINEQPEACSALNRGVWSTRSNQWDPKNFYVNEPYNPYAKFVHTNGARHYAFAYDDYQALQSGYEQCSTNFLKVVFCPDGGGTLPPSGDYKEIESYKGKCLDIHSSDVHKDGGKVQIWECNSQSNQAWILDGQTIRNKEGKCLDVHWDDWESKTNGGKVQIWECNEWGNQKWTFEGGLIKSSNGKCLDIDRPQVGINGGLVHLWDCWGEDNQLWSMQ